MLVFCGPDGPRASECLDPGLLQIDKTLQVVSSDLPIQVQPCACEANGAQRLAAHLRQAREHVLDARTRLGDAMIAPLLRLRDRLTLAAFALDVHTPAFFAQSRFALAIDIALVGQDVPVRVGGIKHVLEMQGVVFACRAHLDLAHQLVALVGIGRNLLAEVGLAVFPGPARVHIRLASIGWLPVSQHGPSLTMAFSSLLSDWLGASTTLASIIWPPDDYL
jgi:hypothetical protein